MTLELVFRPEVPDEINEGIVWYEGRRTGLGREFLFSLKERLDGIMDTPELYGIEYRDTRAAPMPRFPYVVYYRLMPDRIEVVAIQRGDRDPRRWQRRV